MIRWQTRQRLVTGALASFLDVGGRIPEDRPAMLAQIDEALRWPLTAFRPPPERLLGL